MEVLNIKLLAINTHYKKKNSRSVYRLQYICSPEKITHLRYDVYTFVKKLIFHFLIKK